jgi:hypothetical protein
MTDTVLITNATSTLPTDGEQELMAGEDERLEEDREEEEGSEPTPIEIAFSDDEDKIVEPPTVFYRVQQHGPVFLSMTRSLVFLSHQAAVRFFQRGWIKKIASEVHELMTKLATCRLVIAPLWSLNQDALATGEYPVYQPNGCQFIRMVQSEELRLLERSVLVGVDIDIEIGSLFARPTEFQLDNYPRSLQSSHFNYMRSRRHGPVVWDDVGCFVADHEHSLFRVEEVELWTEDIEEDSGLVETTSDRGIKRLRGE